jgi:hypothetical protein
VPTSAHPIMADLRAGRCYTGIDRRKGFVWFGRAGWIPAAVVRLTYSFHRARRASRAGTASVEHKPSTTDLACSHNSRSPVMNGKEFFVRGGFLVAGPTCDQFLRVGRVIHHVPEYAWREVVNVSTKALVDASICSSATMGSRRQSTELKTRSKIWQRTPSMPRRTRRSCRPHALAFHLSVA